MFNQLQDAQLVASSGGAVGPTPFQMEAFSAAREQGVCQSERREWVQNYIQINGTPEQLAEIAERDRINARNPGTYMEEIELLTPGFWTNFALGRRC